MSRNHPQTYPLNPSTILEGTLAGLGATIPMTAAMLLMEQVLPPTDRYPLPPEQITLRLASEGGVLGKLKSKPVRLGASLALHFGFGGTAGALFALLGSRLPLPFTLPPIRLGNRQVEPASAVRGIVFALGVWAGSYLGWIPALGILAPASKHPTQRNILMITAHVVWGAFAGVLMDLLAQRPSKPTNPDTTHTGSAPEHSLEPHPDHDTDTGGANDAAEPAAGV